MIYIGTYLHIRQSVLIIIINKYSQFRYAMLEKQAEIL